MRHLLGFACSLRNVCCCCVCGGQKGPRDHLPATCSNVRRGGQHNQGNAGPAFVLAHLTRNTQSDHTHRAGGAAGPTDLQTSDQFRPVVYRNEPTKRHSQPTATSKWPPRRSKGRVIRVPVAAGQGDGSPPASRVSFPARRPQLPRIPSPPPLRGNQPAPARALTHRLTLTARRVPPIRRRRAVVPVSLRLPCRREPREPSW